MSYKRPKADVVIIGLGWSGSTMAEELTRAGIAEARIPCMDHGNLLPGAIERASGIVLERLAAGERVYLHCRAGWQRSV